MEEMIFMAVTALMGFFWCSMWGAFTAVIADKKGYPSRVGWFLIGFFLSWVGLVIVLIMPKYREAHAEMPEEYRGLSINRPQINDMYEDETMQSGGWKCSRCGALNNRLTGTCGCGMPRPR